MSVLINRQPLDDLIGGAGMSMEEFARLAGVSPVTLSHARNGRRVRAKTWRRIAAGLTKLEAPALAAGMVTAAPRMSGNKKTA